MWIGGKKGGHRPTHRIAWELAYGPIPPGKMVLHHCDNRLCVRPSHLFLGDHQANMDDMTAKGRRYCGPHPHGNYARGEQNHNSKLTQAQARSIRSRYAAGDVSMIRLAEQFGVSKRTILNIVHGRIWRDA